MLGLKLNHVSKRGHWRLRGLHFNPPHFEICLSSEWRKMNAILSRISSATRLGVPQIVETNSNNSHNCKKNNNIKVPFYSPFFVLGKSTGHRWIPKGPPINAESLPCHHVIILRFHMVPISKLMWIHTTEQWLAYDGYRFCACMC